MDGLTIRIFRAGDAARGAAISEGSWATSFLSHRSLPKDILRRVVNHQTADFAKSIVG
jgi:hypothetical protein